jgi:hypothetical protein
LRRTILVSAEFAQHSAAPLQPLGTFAVAGFSAEQAVFGLADEAQSQSSIA